MTPETVLPGTARALLARLATAQSEGRLPSLAAAVVRDGATVWTGARGLVDGAAPTEGTQYRIGSITKTFVAVLVMRSRDEGRLDLNDPLERHVPGTAVGHVTIGQLLSHTAGLRAEPDGDWWERAPGVDVAALLAMLGPERAAFRPGRRFHYSNLGYALLGHLVGRLGGVGWHEAVTAEILDPLGMTGTSYLPRPGHARGWAVHPWADVLLPEPAHDSGALAPAGQLWSTVPDLARWAAFFAGDTGGVLSADTLAEMCEPAGVDDGPEWRIGHGLGPQLARREGRQLAGHTGSMPGFVATVWADRAAATGVVLAANATNGALTGLDSDLRAILAEHEPALPTWSPDPAVPPELLALTGTWYWGPTPHTLRLAAGGTFELAPVGVAGRGTRLRPDGAGGWTGLEGYFAGETLTVLRASDGTPDQLDLGTFRFTREPYPGESWA
ncbi:serine hydrolase [Longispora fulva]|uniref:CubicO group peptidase (Beta-lactamase class C family) n=1 Tax=Longispora fulva TaxID=619741 RepID=A0A8J7GBF5_9ACTN|nr:serine hydrolase domain-containing protein [Longispora fulva]MBG6137358.1 CubicO group peptidase (beta-lactamase class C family) [Longispora fulva]GIG61288.1 serine hydrolase [Longispora fulva]